jgi:hypothetical protein
MDNYFRRWRAVMWRDAIPWARDNILWGVAVLVIPPLLTYLHDSGHSIDWVVISLTLQLYVAAFVIYVLWQSGRAVVKLDSDCHEQLLDAQRTSELERARHTRPEIVPEVLFGLWDVEEPRRSIFTFLYIYVRLTNHVNVDTLITKYEVLVNATGRSGLIPGTAVEMQSGGVLIAPNVPGLPHCARDAEGRQVADFSSIWTAVRQLTPLKKGIHAEGWLKVPFELLSIQMEQNQTFKAVVTLVVTDSFGSCHSSISKPIRFYAAEFIASNGSS